MREKEKEVKPVADGMISIGIAATKVDDIVEKGFDDFVICRVDEPFQCVMPPSCDMVGFHNS